MVQTSDVDAMLCLYAIIIAIALWFICQAGGEIDGK